MAPILWIFVFLAGLAIIPLGFASQDGYNKVFLWLIGGSFLFIPLGLVIGARMKSPICPVCGDTTHPPNSTEGRRALTAREQHRNSEPP